MSDQAPCVRCGRLLHTGEGRILVAFTPDELDIIAISVPNAAIAARAICAMGIIDPERERRFHDAKVEHDFVGDECDCALCGEGWCHYLHAKHRERVEDE